MPELQRRFVELVRLVHTGVGIAEETAPSWLIRPGPGECGEMLGLVSDVYRRLTSDDLPELMPPRERSRVDAVLTYADGSQRILEIDERQHFTRARATTLETYSDELVVAFMSPHGRSVAWRLGTGSLAAGSPDLAHPCFQARAVDIAGVLSGIFWQMRCRRCMDGDRPCVSAMTKSSR